MERSALSPSERSRQDLLYLAGLVAPLTGALATVAFLVGFLMTWQWQWLALALLSGATAGLALFARLWLGRGRPALAAVWLGFVSALFLVGFAVFVAGAGVVLFLLALAVPVGLIFLVAPSGIRPRLALGLEGAAAALAVLWVEFASPVERLAIGSPIRWLIPVAILLLGALIILPASGYPRRIGQRLAFALSLVMAVPALMMGLTVWSGGELDSRTSTWLWLATIVVSVGSVLLTLYALRRTILSPLLAVQPTLLAPMAGAVSETAPVFYEDEIGALATALNEAIGRWKGQIKALEEQVGEHARVLEQRALQARAVSEIARRAVGGAEEKDFLEYAAHVLRESFDLYHSGIYLMEEDGEFAVLRAAGDEGGQVMAANQYRVARGSNNLVGLAAETGELSMIADVSTAPSYVHSPLLPYTACEAALPLKAGERVLGVLDLHSDKANAFGEDDLVVLQAIADYLALVIERTRLQAELQANRAEMDRLFQQMVGRAWRISPYSGRQFLGYRYAGATLTPLDAPAPEDLEALHSGRTVIAQGEEASTLATPIKLRGQTLGVLTLRYPAGESPSEMVAFAEEAAERLALALENARLLEDAQRLATRERLISETSARLRATLDLESVLQTAVREFQQAFGLKEAEIRVQLVEENAEVNA